MRAKEKKTTPRSCSVPTKITLKSILTHFARVLNQMDSLHRKRIALKPIGCSIITSSGLLMPSEDVGAGTVCGPGTCSSLDHVTVCSNLKGSPVALESLRK